MNKQIEIIKVTDDMVSDVLLNNLTIEIIKINDNLNLDCLIKGDEKDIKRYCNEKGYE